MTRSAASPKFAHFNQLGSLQHIVASVVIVLLGLFAPLRSWGEVSTTQKDIDHVWGLRHEAERKSAPGTPEALLAARESLIEALGYLDRTEVRERAEGSHTLLTGGRFNVNFDLAHINAKLHDRDGTIQALEAMSLAGWVPKAADHVEKESVFAPYVDDSTFKSIIARLRVPDHVWGVGAIAAPYKERLTVEERIAGLSLFWSEVRNNFVHFDNVPDLEWDKVYMQFLPRVMAAETTRDYYDVLMQLAPLLQDGHTNIYPPRELSNTFYSRPPLRTELIEGKVLVTAVRSAKLAEQVHVGDEVVSIDGVPVQDYADKRVRPYVSGSTPQDRSLRAFSYQLLSGDANKPAQLALRSATDVERTVSVARTGYTDVVEPPPFEFKMLPNGIAYLSLDHFESDAGVKAFEAALPQILSSRGLVLDLRRNGGGSTNYGLAILSYLTDQPILSALSMTRNETALERASSGNITWAPLGFNGEPYKHPPRSQSFNGSVTVLVGPQTFSAAEDFLVSYSMLKRGAIVGEPSGGSTGQPMFFPLPGGGRARICVKRDTFRDGTRFVGVGLKPTVFAKQSVEGLRTGRDPVLEAAVAALARAN